MNAKGHPMTDTQSPARSDSLQERIAAAVAAYNALSPDDKARHDYEQRRSFVRGMCPGYRNYEKWCAEVDRLLPPLAAQPAPAERPVGGDEIDDTMRCIHKALPVSLFQEVSGRIEAALRARASVPDERIRREALEEAAKVAADFVMHDEKYAEKYPDEALKYDNRAHRSRAILSAIRALSQSPQGERE